MTHFSKYTYFRFITFMLMISTYLPIIFNNLPPIVGSHHIWTILWFFSLIVLDPKVLITKSMFLLWIYSVFFFILIFTLWEGIDSWNKIQIRNEFYNIIVGVSIFAYYIKNRDYIGLAKLVKTTFIFVIITSIMTVITAFLNPMYARDIIGVSSTNNESIKEAILSYKKFGGGNFSFASALVGVFPILIYFYKKTSLIKSRKSILIISMLIFFFALVSIQLFANIVISVIIILFSISGSNNIVKTTIGIILIVSSLLLIPSETYSEVSKQIGNWFDPSSELFYKFNDLANFTISDDFEETGIGQRASRFPLLWSSFLSNPILGGEYWNQHLHWMNKFAVYGLLGTVPFFYFLYYHFKKTFRYINIEFSFFFFLSMLSIFALGAVKTLIGRELWYMVLVLIPGSYFLPLLNKTKEL